MKNTDWNSEPTRNAVPAHRSTEPETAPMTPAARRNAPTRPVAFQTNAGTLADWHHRRDWDAEPTHDDAPAYLPETESTSRVTARLQPVRDVE